MQSDLQSVDISSSGAMRGSTFSRFATGAVSHFASVAIKRAVECAGALALGLGFVLLLSVSAGAQSINLPRDAFILPKSTDLFLATRTGEPPGFAELCRKLPSECRVARAHGVETTKDGRVVLQASLVKQMMDINESVNEKIKPEEEAAGEDNWQVEPTSGDCEDYALTKRHELIAEGWPSSAVVIATAFIPDGQYHAVLVVRSDNGDYVLDNLSGKIRPWEETRYAFYKVMSDKRPTEWERTF